MFRPIVIKKHKAHSFCPGPACTVSHCGEVCNLDISGHRPYPTWRLKHVTEAAQMWRESGPVAQAFSQVEKRLGGRKESMTVTQYEEAG